MPEEKIDSQERQQAAGEKGETCEIPIQTVTVPDDKFGGDEMEFRAVDGTRMRTVIPLGKKPGDKFAVQLAYQPIFFLNVRVPPGYIGGDTLDFSATDGQVYRAKVPENLTEGEQFQVRMPVGMYGVGNVGHHKQIVCAKCGVTYMSASGTSTFCPQCRNATTQAA